MAEIQLNIEGSVAQITLNRPQALNALTSTMYAELSDAVDECRRNPEVRVVVLTGAGRAFCTGGDLKAMQERLQTAGSIPAQRAWFIEHPSQIVPKLYQLDKPLIAKVNGPALGAGCCLALLCDIRIAAEGAVFGAPFVKRGLIPDWGGTHLLPRILGHSRAAELVFTGRTIDARHAEEIGLISRAVPQSELDGVVAELAGEIAAQAPAAVRLAKQALRLGAETTLTESVLMEANLQAQCMLSDDFREGLVAFFEKRAPRFVGK